MSDRTENDFEFIDENTVRVLDHGFVQFVGKLGDDRAIASFGRASFGKKAYKSMARNQALIDYFFEHRHTSPIEAGEMVFTMKMPIFVARQHMRHRTASMNELSLRYQEHPGNFYTPPLSRFCEQGKWNKQDSGGPLPEHVAAVYQSKLREHSEASWELYQMMLHDGEHSVSREIARTVLPTNFYTQLAWKMDLKNLFGYLFLRNDSHAQWEIQQFAKAIEYFVKREYPCTYAAFKEFWLESVNFTAEEIAVVKDLCTFSGHALALQAVDSDAVGRRLDGDRRMVEFLKKLGLSDEEIEPAIEHRRERKRREQEENNDE